MTANIYQTVRYVHVATVHITIILFLIRGYWLFTDSPLLLLKITRTLPHINDTILLGAGATLVFLLSGYPLAQGWLLAKLAALLVYIGLGMLAMRPGRPKAVRLTSWFLALIVFAYIVLVAIKKQPWPL